MDALWQKGRASEKGRGLAMPGSPTCCVKKSLTLTSWLVAVAPAATVRPRTVSATTR